VSDGAQERDWVDDGSGAAVHALGDPVRRELYDYVSRRDEPVCREEAAVAVGIGRPLAAYHLDKLCDLGLLTATYRRPAGRGGPGAGRPAKVYARSPREFAVTVPSRQYELAGLLLAEAVDGDRSGQAATALLRAARGAGASLGLAAKTRWRSAQARGQAAPAVVSTLAEHGFEPYDDGPNAIRLRNCPFHRLAARYPEVVCGMSLALLEGLVDGLGVTGMRPVLDPRQGHCCVAIETREEQDSRERHDATTGC
jgi:predicted ArsR family transcriptional regulator